MQGQPNPELSAAMQMRFMRDGNRYDFELIYFMRRHKLAFLVMAECLEHQGRFMPGILDMLWLILGEVDWCIPAHGSYRPGDVLPDPESPYIDLFACATGMNLAYTLKVLGEELAAVSPALCRRIEMELERRLVVPMEQLSERQWWLSGKNNWTPWCSANLLVSALVGIKDRARLIRLIGMLLEANEKFIATYGDDGGCDEGPGYWTVAPGMLLCLLETLNSASGDALLDIYQNPKIKKMGEYIVVAHLAGPWGCAAADCLPHLSSFMPQTYRYGERIGSEGMKQLALLSCQGFDTDCVCCPVDPIRNCGGILQNLLMEFFWIPDGAVFTGIKRQPSNYLPDLQLMVARENPLDDRKGLTLTIKGGHNGENHNHNDVGQFSVMADGEPLIIDVGVGTYTRKTFSAERYDFWYIGAQGHNVPEVNGILQQAGAQFRAVDAVFSEGVDAISMQMDIAKAYPEASGLKHLIRRAELNRKNGGITVSDEFSFDGRRLDVIIPLYTRVKPEIAGQDLVMRTGAGAYTLRLSGISAGNPEDIILDDPRMSFFWGEKIYRTRLHASFANGAGTYSLFLRRTE